MSVAAPAPVTPTKRKHATTAKISLDLIIPPFQTLIVIFIGIGGDMLIAFSPA
jgi:hypothetical protein